MWIRYKEKETNAECLTKFNEFFVDEKGFDVVGFTYGTTSSIKLAKYKDHEEAVIALSLMTTAMSHGATVLIMPTEKDIEACRLALLQKIKPEKILRS